MCYYSRRLENNKKREVASMTGKTHLSIGVMSALVISRPTTVKELVVCAGIASIGAVVCDVDVSQSDSRNKLNHIVIFLLLAVAFLAIAENQLQLGLMSYIKQNQTLYQSGIGIASLIFICLFGITTPHRSFMHSALGMCAVGVATYYAYPYALHPMLIAMASHIIIDFLNHKKVRIFYPFKFGICFGICKSDGKVNDALFLLGILTSVYYIAYQLFHMTF